jgi:Cys-tRNA(Pro)/Cys-tRNA(Cys) deacylase
VPYIAIATSPMKTNAARQLDSLGIGYQLVDYDVDPNDLAAETVAEKLGVDPYQVFKTLVVRGEKTGILLAVIPGNLHLDLKALARLAGDRKVDTVPLKEVQPLTGYIRGGVTAIAAKKPYPVYVDEMVEVFDQIFVSAGMRGTMMKLAPADYLRAVNGTVGAIATEKP